MTDGQEAEESAQGGLGDFLHNIRTLPRNAREAIVRHGSMSSDRARSQAIFSNFFLHIHSTRVHPNSLRPTYTWGLGVALISLFIILTATGALLMVYYNPSTEFAYDTIKDLHFVVPAGRFIRNIHRWAAHLMVAGVFLHMARVFYTAAYKRPREFNWVLGMSLFVLTLGLSFSGYLLPWDQLAFWAITIGANIAGSPNEVVHALGLPPAFNIGDLQKEILLGASFVGQEALLRFYLLHVIVLPLAMTVIIGVHVWRVRKDGGLSRPGGTPTPAGKGVPTMEPSPAAPEDVAEKTYGLMCVVKGQTPQSNQDPEETLSSWPHLMRAEVLVFMLTMLVCLILGFYFDAPLREPANPAVPENPAKAPWYFLGLQEMVSYSAFVGGIAVPALVIFGLCLIPFLDRERDNTGLWFSSKRGKRTAWVSLAFGAVAAVAAVAIPVNFGWLRSWFPHIPQLIIIIVNPGSLLTAVYVVYSVAVTTRTRSTRMGAIALFTCFLIGFVILTYVGTQLRGPNWDFYWTKAQWPAH